MSNEELDSQLSAMFDDSLPASECELLARRLARDEQLRSRWGRYAVIDACIRGEHGVRLETMLASKVSAAIKQEAGPAPAPATGHAGRGFFTPWVTVLSGLACAASVAAVAILWMRSAGPVLVAQSPPVQHSVVPSVPQRVASEQAAPQLAAVQTAHPRQSREPDSYVVPALGAQGPMLVPPTDL